MAEKVYPMLQSQKNGVNNATLTQWQTGKHLCLVQICTNIITRLRLYSRISDESPINTVRVEKSRTSITYQMKIKTIRLGMLSFKEDYLMFSHKEVGTQSL